MDCYCLPRRWRMQEFYTWKKIKSETKAATDSLNLDVFRVLPFCTWQRSIGCVLLWLGQHIRHVAVAAEKWGRVCEIAVGSIISHHRTLILTQTLSMAESANSVVPSTELLEWPKQDKRRFLHAVYRVGDLDRTIKFYTECFGMKLLRKRDIPEEKYSNAFLGFGPEESHFVVELTYNYGVDKYDIGTGFGHFAIATQDVYKLVEDVKAKGGTVTREPGPVKGGTSVIAFVKDPDGYLFEIIQRGPTPEPLCQVMLRVGDLDRSIKFYEKALGMRLLRKIDRPEQKYTLAMMGYAEEHETTVLELTYNYGVTEYTKGNAYAQVAISTDDVYKSAEVVNLVTQELGGKMTRQPGPIPGMNTKITSFLDPDGWKTVLVDNADFLKELEAKE
ncbi:glyoxalase I homolog [Striga hermonthica]|uniref:Lactoylglutathione lyase n=1 Tax=Striga hermonthica TaxID=68872 RepID=A0A9N7NIM0_STRHE|nr:glyoxalase I homolog [Striga hermonthica]